MAEAMDVNVLPPPDGSKTRPSSPRKIVALSEDVVNKIAAGEIIVAPVHALKELIENAVDAGSTSLEVVVKDGGLKLLQITDNGHGIEKGDLPILCERFTTSKLETFEDLSSIGTYGFRGEALASISHIAHLSVTTRTKESSCAWKAHYAGGKLAPSKPGQDPAPKSIAGRPGTQITVEDLFYNIPTRRRAFRSASEEFAKILDIVGRYSVHCSGIGFSCKKHGESSMAISVASKATTLDRIRQVHGAAVARELIQFDASSERWGFRCEGWVSNANYSIKKTTMLLFINHRSVESTAIKKAIEQTYQAFLPKGGHPFSYLSLEIEPQRVDVNVHPTKREVNFLNEDEIIETICSSIQIKLGSVDTSRTFMTQSLLPGPSKTQSPSVNIPTITPSSDRLSMQTPSRPQGLLMQQPSTKRKTLENNLVRTDSKVRKITSMLSTERRESTADELPETFEAQYPYEIDDETETTVCRLMSIKDLRATVRDNMHNELTDLFSSHTFVGIVDDRRRMVAIQGGVKLYLIDYGLACNEYFYQVGLTDFGNFGVIRFEPPLSLDELLRIAVEHEKRSSQSAEDEGDDFDWDMVALTVKEHLISKRDMLVEYFSLDISETGDLSTIPLLVKGYVPCMAKLPQFLLRLGPHVDWNDEKSCFHTFLAELASFYVPEAMPVVRDHTTTAATSRENDSKDSTGNDIAPMIEADIQEEPNVEDKAIEIRRKQLHHALEYVMFPAFKNRLVATKGMLQGVVEIADLKGLYRVFERC
ncbi:DNA mismatch repair protein MutL [Pseudovirgaria hyperparasitica]|uniref:DNA mismatch repair protein MutL n=1 Tax=Pseudovirgaria hyperparasitica TaxID=470096 RepID=A0A6A6VVM6_9PEZI|nr:DNA mismatch repair protein MutL [Pseudovirgaria hyperparasitica]KAF2754632.1 DNA mismatch repair protein MutL [Pseudovirgaria hyperparasitica]